MDLKPAPKNVLLSQIADRLGALGEIEDPDRLARRLIERERMMTTGVKEGFAFPHAFTPQIDTLKLTVVLIREGTDYESLDGKPVEIIFLLLGPLSHQDRHLRVLARLSRIATGSGFLDTLRQATSADEVVTLLTESDKFIAAGA
jgi:mannitol/fructose-specific phosphotransferase system IIA component (Ntr-type)